MKKLSAIIEQAADGTWAAYLENEMFSGMGETAETAKKNMMESILFYVTTCKEDGYQYPSWLDGEYEIVYRFDTKSILKYYRGIFTKAALERLTGLNQKQLGDYASGRSRPRPATAKKIERALHALGDELKSLSIS